MMHGVAACRDCTVDYIIFTSHERLGVEAHEGNVYVSLTLL